MPVAFSGREARSWDSTMTRRGAAVEQTMRDYWDAKARENAMFYIHSELDYAHCDPEEFWRSGQENLERTLGLFDDQVRAEDHVVEIGCGMGRMTRPLAQRARKVIALDVSEEMVHRAQQALADLANVTFMVGNGRDLSGVPDASADVVYSFIVFQHIPDPAVTCQYVRDIGRVLRPGGWTLFQVSDLPAIHRAESHTSQRSWRNRLGQLRGNRPRGCLSPPWLGSAVPRPELLAALAEGDLVLDATVGDGTQYCFVHAHRPGASDPSTP